MNKLTAQILVNIINQEMSMPANSVWIRDQNTLIPEDMGLYIVVGETSAYTMANSTYMVQEADGNQHQISQVNQKEMITIDVISRANTALTRKFEVLAAMQSFYSQQQQELNNFKIFRIPQAFNNTSYAEGGSQLNRYTITIACMVWYRKDTILNSPLGDYYDDFSTRVDDDNTIGTNTPIAEFEINSGGIVP